MDHSKAISVWLASDNSSMASRAISLPSELRDEDPLKSNRGQ
jgi:hypothetical protein